MLLNAEVIPAERGWLGRMSSFFSATPRIGALAPKLLYEDGAIDQAGIDFVRPGSGSEWAPRRRFRGLHGMLPAANVAQAIAAVGHDCVMVEARAFVDSGGLGSHYLTSAYQGAELCLRLNEAGLESWYIPQVELHRLDDHAGAPEKDTPSALYDRWLFSQRHGHSIERSAGAISGSVVRREQGRRCGARGSLVHRACAGTVGLPVDARVAKLRAKPWDSDRFRPWASEYSEIPRELFSISGMLSTQERQMLYYLARHDFVGEGVIADMGTYLGASTMCFAAGVRQRSFRGPIIHTYDLFKLGDSQPEVDHFPGVLPVNSGTRPVFEANLREYLNLIVVHEGDILDETWDGDPIEFLFIDLAKSYKVLDHLLLAFFPALIPSRSLVVMQDYLWATAGPWHHIVLEKLGAYFEYVVDTDVASVVFMLTRKIPLSVLEQCLYMRIPRAEKIELMDRAIEKLDTPEKRRFLSASRELLLSGKDEQWGMYYHVL
jgi:predicted O-methyltransferase YrrM